MQRTILIVEDVDTCASTLEIVFSGMKNVQVVTAGNGEQAWRLVEQGIRGLAAVVTDLQMRNMDGFELIERLRTHHMHSNVPIIVITGSSELDAPERALRLGANAFFAKPYSPALVREKLEELLNHDATEI